jgi:DNA-directed RNA polymerase specialized sigma24 family protein
VSPDWPALIKALEDEANREEAWAEFRSAVERLARAVASSAHAVIAPSDLAQDVMLKLQDPEKRRMLRATRRPGGYLAVLLRNASRDAIARQDREQTAWQIVARDEIGPLADMDPVDRVALLAIIEALPNEDRELLRLRYLEDLPVQQDGSYAERRLRSTRPFGRPAARAGGRIRPVM